MKMRFPERLSITSDRINKIYKIIVLIKSR